MDAVEIRRTVDEKAAFFHQVDEVALYDQSPSSTGVSGHQVKQAVKRSTRDDNPEGLLEKELAARARQAEPAGRRYKKRRRSELSAADIVDVLHCYMVERVS